jgi:hypothetical protein
LLYTFWPPVSLLAPLSPSTVRAPLSPSTVRVAVLNNSNDEK